MATYRQIHIKIWSSPDFQELSCNGKFAFIYLFSNSHRNESALYRITPKTISNETDIPADQVKSALDELTANGLIKYDHDQSIIWIINAIKYQKMSPNEIKSILKDLNTLDHPYTEELKEYYGDLISTYEAPSEVIENTYREPSTKGKGNDKGSNSDKDKGNNLSLEIEQFRSRYSPDQLKIIDRYLEVLRTTRRSGTIAESIIHGVYEDMNKYDPLIVEYACSTVVKNPKLHDKKENYFAGILRNTTMDEATKGIQGINRASPKTNADDIINQYCAGG